MTIFRVKQYFIHIQQRMRSEKMSRRLVAIASVVIVITFILSVYAFIVDLTMDISFEQEMQAMPTLYETSTQEEETAADNSGAEENDYGFSVPQGAVTPVPMNQR